jgi:lipopolysaccharide transport system ATP-binding protein
MDEVPIQVKGVSKKFCRNLKTSIKYGIQDITLNMLGLSSNPERLRKGEFWAVDDVSFEVHKGETLGIIGPNGSGKSTILKMLNGIFMPDRGEIKINGRVGALIEIGAGFHPMLTGRENIYVNGAILGMTKKEIDEKFDEIVEFADIGDFIDSPVKFYSSGMFVRLGFSIAACMEPEILLIDEVLSVGDFAFQNKSLRRLGEIRERANAVVFVSHNLEHVRNICDRVLVIEGGTPIFYGDTEEGVTKYIEMVHQRRLRAIKKSKPFVSSGRLSSGDAVLTDHGLLDKSGSKINKVNFGEDITLFFEFELKKDLEEIFFAIAIYNDRGVNCVGRHSTDCDETRFYNVPKGKHRLIVRYKNPNLVPGVYVPRFHIRDPRTFEGFEIATDLEPFVIEGDIVPRGVVHIESDWEMEAVKA